MGIKSFKPITPGRRQMTVSTFEEITKIEPERSLVEPLKKTGGRALATTLAASQQARKQWMADHLQMRGSVAVDAGAVEKIVGEGKSLLPIGMTGVEGDFSRGDVIAVRGPDGAEIARGLANYASSEARLLCRRSSADFERLLGYAAEPEMIHRDNLVLTRS